MTKWCIWSLIFFFKCWWRNKEKTYFIWCMSTSVWFFGSGRINQKKKIISIVNRSFVINKFLSLTVNLSQYAGMHWFILGKKSLFLSSWIKKTNIFLVFFSIAVIPVNLCITLDLSPGWILSIKPPIKIYQGLF